MANRKEFEEKVDVLVKKKIERKLFKKKDSEEYEVVEEVFDIHTLMALYDLYNRGYIEKIYGVVASGKEARIYWGISPQGEDLAIKIFLVATAEFRRSMLKYIEGDPRFKKVKRKRRHLIRAWCSKEFKNLKLAQKAGVRVPKPIAFKENVLVMEFINAKGKRGVPAPLLKEAPPSDPEYAYNVILDYIRKLYINAELIHADLSEYNVLNREPEFIIIDWGSAVKKSHPNAYDFLVRDIKNILAYFRRLGVKVDDYNNIVRELLEHNPLY